MIKNLSVFFPCYNEAQNITEIVERASEVLEKLQINYEIIIVNDGSKDNTKEVTEKLITNNSKVRVINHQTNLGYGEALKTGFYNAKYDTIVYTDSDGQFDFSQVTKFLDKIEDYDLVLGYRIKRADHFIRLLFAKGWNLTQFIFFGLRVKDVDCGFKMVRKKVLETIPRLESTRGGMINAELAIKTQKYGFKVTQVGVNHYPRTLGKPTGANLRVIIKSYLDLINLWWKLLEDKWLFFSLLGILLLATILRIWRLPEYMTFLGDEGRDALVIKDILVNKHLHLLGPPTSIGGMYLGPLYYYMMAVPMAIFWLKPEAAAYQVALIGVLTVFLVYYLGKQWFGKGSGLVGALLYTVSPITIFYSRSSWNPNPAPFFTLLAVLGLYKTYKSGNYWWLCLTGLGVAFAAQMHYLALILVPIAALLWFLGVFVLHPPGVNRKHVVGGTISAVVLFLILMSPLVIFDFRHNFMNYKAISTFFLARDTTVNLNPLNTLSRIIPIYNNNLIGRYMTVQNQLLTPLLSVLVVLPLMLVFWQKLKGGVLEWPYLSLSVWLSSGIAGLALYKQTIYDHYLGFLNPVPYLLFGSLLVWKKRWWQVTILALTTILVILNFQNSLFLKEPSRELQRTQEITKFVINESGGKSFNFALLAKTNYDSAYQFYLDLYGHKPKQVPFDITDQLFVVCEDPVCEPINNPKYEIAGFGWAKIEKEQDFNGVRVYKLIHNPTGKK